MQPIFPSAVIALTLFSSTSAVAADSETKPEAPEVAAFDIGIELSGSTDYMDSGLTNSNHKPSVGLKISPSFGIFYGSFSAATINYGTPQPRLETTFAIGATPEFGALSIDFNLARRIKFDDPTADRWLPYITATYAWNEMFSSSLGAGYYIYDDPGTADFFELYAASTYTHESGVYFTGEAYWEPNSDGAGNAYYAFYGTLGVPFLEKFEAIGKLGYEGYDDKISTPPYIWYEASLGYNVNDHLGLLVGYHGNDLSAADCPQQAFTDCRNSLFAKVTLKASLSDLQK
jgi:hypothetical protein